MRRRHFMAAAAAAACSGSVLSQPSSTIKLLVGFPAGGSTDAIARVMADQLQKSLGRPVIVDNRPGIAGRMATVAVKNAAPGESLFMVGASTHPGAGIPGVIASAMALEAVIPKADSLVPQHA